MKSAEPARRMGERQAQPEQYETSITAEEQQFLVRSGVEIVHLLRQVRDRAAMLTASCGDGSFFALTSVLEVEPDDDELILDMPGQRELAAALCAADIVTLTTHIDGVKIKFQVPGVAVTAHEGRDALAAALPERVVRLQRREYFRVTCPVATPPRCAIPYASRGEKRLAQFDVADVSLGGLAFTARPGGIVFEPGSELEDCTIALPGEGSFTTTLEVRTVRDVQLRSGHALHVGCRFVRPPADGLARLQRYTMRIESERKAKLS